MDTTTEVQPMRYHGPGWTVDGPTRVVIDRDTGEEYEGSDTFQVWAPNDGRDHWAASWGVCEDDLNIGHGGFRKGSTLDEVLAVFDHDKAREFGALLRQAAEAHR